MELTAEPEGHIRERHPDLRPDHREKTGETLADPDVVRRSVRMTTARHFSKWYTDLRNGRHVVVVVLGEGEVEWQRS